MLACPGSTRSSVSAVVINVDGYSAPGFTLCRGEYSYRNLNCSASSEEPYSGIQNRATVNRWYRSMSATGTRVSTTP